MRDDSLAQGDEFGVAHVVLGIIGPPREDDEAPCAVGFEQVIAFANLEVEDLVSDP